MITQTNKKRVWLTHKQGDTVRNSRVVCTWAWAETQVMTTRIAHVISGQQVWLQNENAFLRNSSVVRAWAWTQIKKSPQRVVCVRVQRIDIVSLARFLRVVDFSFFHVLVWKLCKRRFIESRSPSIIDWNSAHSWWRVSLNQKLDRSWSLYDT